MCNKDKINLKNSNEVNEYWCYSDKTKRFPSYRVWKQNYILCMQDYSYKKYKKWLKIEKRKFRKEYLHRKQNLLKRINKCMLNFNNNKTTCLICKAYKYCKISRKIFKD